MKTIKKENCLILTDEKDNVVDFAAYLEASYDRIKNNHLVIDISKYGQLKLQELLAFLPLSNKHRKKKKSFILVNDTINIDPVPDEMVIAPTLREAEDILQMEEIERDMGF
ncbi:MAG TPA: ribonuclease Z [Flavobacteriaceae bacterium]|nr:ribonuclease Z [Flavobacteriaceae bacterium]